ncbi:hypothetical protein AVEN_148452-1, partial [Araneus ventricosus]
GCSVTEVAISEKAGRNFGIGSPALHSTERRLMKEGKKTINWGLDGKDWFHFGEGEENNGSSFLTLNCWLRCGTRLAGWCHKVGECEEASVT